MSIIKKILKESMEMTFVEFNERLPVLYGVYDGVKGYHTFEPKFHVLSNGIKYFRNGNYKSEPISVFKMYNAFKGGYLKIVEG